MDRSDIQHIRQLHNKHTHTLNEMKNEANDNDDDDEQF